MKVSVSLPGEDVAFLDEYATSHACASRSAAVHHAIQALRHRALDSAYEGAWAEWEDGDEAATWDTAVGDGV